jgi:aminopeptidase N
MFDNVSYQKGGAILHLLRVTVGDSAFFKGLNQYLERNKFGNVEAHQLRLSLESVSGMDLNWFFDQWFFNHGHPAVDITYDYSKSSQVTVNISQHQSELFRLPIKVDVYEGSRRTTYEVIIDDREEHFTFPYTNRPDLVNVDADKIMLWQKKDDKNMDNYAFQYAHGNYVDRLEAVYAALVSPGNPKSLPILRQALKDRSERIRTQTVSYLPHMPQPVKASLAPDVVEVLRSDRPLVQAEAIDFLAALEDPRYAEVFRQHLNDSSYSVAGSALSAMMSIDPKEATAFAVQHKSTPAKGALADAMTQALMETRSASHYEYVMDYYGELEWYETAGVAQALAEYLATLKDDKLVMRGVQLLADASEKTPEAYKPMFEPTISFAIQHVADEKKKAGKKRLAADIQKEVKGI